MGLTGICCCLCCCCLCFCCYTKEFPLLKRLSFTFPSSYVLSFRYFLEHKRGNQTHSLYLWRVRVVVALFPTPATILLVLIFHLPRCYGLSQNITLQMSSLLHVQRSVICGKFCCEIIMIKNITIVPQSTDILLEDMNESSPQYYILFFIYVTLEFRIGQMQQKGFSKPQIWFERWNHIRGIVEKEVFFKIYNNTI